MKLNSEALLNIALIIVVVLIILYVIFSKPKAKAPDSVSADEKPWTVYGSNSCGWTKKQLKHLDEKNIPYKFVDCDKEDCGQISAFPTNVKPDGSRAVGFIEAA
jgi:glutaredoxin